MRSLSTAIAVILATATTPAFSFDPSDMHQGRTMMEASLKVAFASLGIDHDPMTLTLIQIAAIDAIVSRSDDTDADKKLAIEQALRQE
jgi:hypothetical protein